MVSVPVETSSKASTLQLTCTCRSGFGKKDDVDLQNTELRFDVQSTANDAIQVNKAPTSQISNRRNNPPTATAHSAILGGSRGKIRS